METTNDTSSPQVLIVGAGPTGLTLALFLIHSGVKPRIIEKSSGPGQTSRAMVVQARTLEYYRFISIANDVIDGGIPMKTAHVWKGGSEVAQIKFGDFGENVSPYPFALSFPQDDHEKLLGDRLKELGIEIEWETELVSFTQNDNEVKATLHKGDLVENCSPAYICGCDGAHSTVRKDLGIEFPGGTYDQRFFVADVEATGVTAIVDGFSMCLGTHELCLVFPVRSSGMHRLIGLLPDEVSEKDDVTFDDVKSYVEHLVGIEVTHLNWFSSYRVHHRVSGHFREGNAFLLGDAGHIHSPAGGQGMNTGIGDAMNLSWKLAAVLQKRANPAILDTYEEERIAFANSLVATTDRVFKLVIGPGLGGQVVREAMVPHLIPFLMGFSTVREAAFRLISQTKVNYTGSSLSVGHAGHLHGGDRLPWATFADGLDNFAPLGSLDWQVHVYGSATSELKQTANGAGVRLNEFPWSDSMAEEALKRDAMYLVRPDGYVGLASPDQDVEKLVEYITKFNITSRAITP